MSNVKAFTTAANLGKGYSAHSAHSPCYTTARAVKQDLHSKQRSRPKYAATITACYDLQSQLYSILIVWCLDV